MNTMIFYDWLRIFCEGTPDLLNFLIFTPFSLFIFPSFMTFCPSVIFVLCYLWKLTSLLNINSASILSSFTFMDVVNLVYLLFQSASQLQTELEYSDVPFQQTRMQFP